MGIIVDVRGSAKAIQMHLQATDKNMPNILKEALNRTGQKIGTLVARKVSTMKQVPYHATRRRWRISKATKSRLSVTVRFFTQTIPAHRLLTPAQLSWSLKTRRSKAQTSKGVRAGSHFWPSAFVQAVKNGNVVVMKRRGKPRYPTYSPGVDLLPEAQTAADAIVNADGRRIFKEEYESRLARWLKRTAKR